jgi:hypothetical protein
MLISDFADEIHRADDSGIPQSLRDLAAQA